MLKIKHYLLKTYSRLLKIPAYFQAFTQVFLLKFSANSPYKRTANIGYLRGIDFYKTTDFYRALANAMINYKHARKIYPNIVKPKTLGEKIFWFKFFGEIKVPEAGNKLLTAQFIPAAIKHLISCPAIVWHSKHAAMPKNHEIAAGSYYLKANHGSGMVKKIQFPLAEKEVTALELLTNQWLNTNFGLGDGEWWYNTFCKEILIEKNISTDVHSITWGAFIIGGDIAYINMVKKTPTDIQINWLNQDFSLLACQNNDYKRIQEFKLPKNIEQINHICLKLGAQFNFVRVDLLIDADDQLYLGEMTFSPGNALVNWPAEMNLQLGGKWQNLI